MTGKKQQKAGRAARETLSLNRGWLFHEGDIEEIQADGHKRAYLQSKTRSGEGVISQDFDDTEWEKVNLPHDYVLAHRPERGIPQYCGCRKRGVVWYRRHFRLEESDRGKNIELVFDGAASFAEVYFNGAPVVSSRSGYTAFRCDVTPMAEYGDFLNTIAVRVDGSSCEGWWYEGGGLYRDTWLVKRTARHFLTDGIHADPRLGADGEWVLPFEAEVGNTGEKNASVTAEVTLVAPDGKIAAHGVSRPVTAKIFETAKIAFKLPVGKKVQIWELDRPRLYRVEAKLLDTKTGETLDETSLRIGFRTIRFDADKGFFLNGKPVKIYGTCNHQDHACVGVALPKSVERFRIRKLKEMGCNAYRSAHNPPSASLLDVCDELGMLVMDENRHFSTAEQYLEHLQWLVRRDRNHPSVILWSLFNEEPLQGGWVGYEMARKMAALVKKLDDSRFTTGAMNGGFLTELNASCALDVIGINYYQFDYDKYHQKAPKHPVISSEDTSAIITRDAPATVWEKNILSDLDTEAVPWGATHRNSWKKIAERPWMSGCFIWTGFDYRGEPTPYPWPANSSYFGILDLCGFPKNAFYIHQAQWRKDIPVLHLAPHWNLNVPNGEKVRVLAISNAKVVELFLNGKSCGRQKVDPYEMNTFEVAYEQGELKAVSYDGHGGKVAETVRRTAGKPFALRLEPDRTEVADDAYDTVPVSVYAVDRDGVRVPDATDEIAFSLSGDGVIVGVGNGDENSLESELEPKRKLFQGYAQTMIRAKLGGRGQIVLRASADGLQSAETAFCIQPDAADRIYAATPDRFRVFNDFIMSPVSVVKPDAETKLGADDMNSWERVRPGTTQKIGAENFVMFRAEAPGMCRPGKRILFRGVTGKAEFILGGTVIYRKDDPAADECRVKFPNDAKGDTLTVCIQADKDGFAGLGGQVVLEN